MRVYVGHYLWGTRETQLTVLAVPCLFDHICVWVYSLHHSLNRRGKREDALSVRKKFISREGDHLTLLAVLRAFGEVARKDAASWASDNFINVR